jgi:hypothetical protein
VSVPKSPALATSKRWAEALGNKVEVAKGKAPDGAEVELLQIQRGQFVVLVLEPRPGILEIDCPQDLPREVKDRLSGLTPELKQQVLLTFLDRLLRHPRSGYAFNPPQISSLDQIDRWLVTQSVVIDDKDPSAFQRFADAIQEVISVFMGAGMILAAVMQKPPPGATSGSAASVQPPSGMYR